MERFKVLALTFCLVVPSRDELGTAFIVAPQSERRIHIHPTRTAFAAVSTDETASSSTDIFENQSERSRVKEELIRLGERTDRGFRATRSDVKTARQLIFELAKFNRTPEPAISYYSKEQARNCTDPSIQGKWNLIFTDAPDITSLQNPNPFVELGRIGQECTPPTIANVIEWKAPEWIDSSPIVPSFLKGTGESRILQKVLTKGTATPGEPTMVQLDIAGFQVVAPPSPPPLLSDLSTAISERGLIPALLEQRPVDLQGPLQGAPFGEFEVLYLDETMRITRTGQNYVAVNLRLSKDEAWF